MAPTGEVDRIIRRSLAEDNPHRWASYPTAPTPQSFPAAAEPRLKRLTRRTRSIGLAAGRDRAPAANPPGLPDCKAPFTRLGRPDSRSSHGYPSMALSPCCTLLPRRRMSSLLRSADLRPPGGSHLPLSRALRIAGSGEATRQRDREARQRTTAAHRRPGPCMTILRIAAPTPLRTLLDYRAPTPETPAIGTRVRVPLGRRSVVGVVMEHAARSDLDPKRLRSIGDVLDETPLLPPDLVALARWAADYYQHPIGEVVAQVLPLRARRDQAASGRRVAAVRLTDTGSAARIADHGRAPARQRALVALANAPGQTLAMTALAARGVSSGVVRSMIDLELVARTSLASGFAPADADVVRTTAPMLTEEQASAAAAIDGGTPGFRAILLDGVTGSGKTEVYFAAMQAALEAGRQVLLLVPEIGLTLQTLNRIRGRFDVPLAVLHSALAEGARMESWRAVAAGHARIVVGTRSAVFAALPEPGLIVVDEEHDESYKQQDGFRYSARDLAVKRASLLGTPVVLGSATPSLASLANARAHRYAHAFLTRRAGKARPRTSD